MPDGSAYFFTRHSSGYAEIGIAAVRARNYVTQQVENWNKFNSSSATFLFRLRSATLVANSGSTEPSTTGSVSNRSAEG